MTRASWKRTSLIWPIFSDCKMRNSKSKRHKQLQKSLTTIIRTIRTNKKNQGLIIIVTVARQKSIQTLSVTGAGRIWRMMQRVTTKKTWKSSTGSWTSERRALSWHIVSPFLSSSSHQRKGKALRTMLSKTKHTWPCSPTKKTMKRTGLCLFLIKLSSTLRSRGRKRGNLMDLPPWALRTSHRASANPSAAMISAQSMSRIY